MPSLFRFAPPKGVDVVGEWAGRQVLFERYCCHISVTNLLVAISQLIEFGDKLPGHEERRDLINTALDKFGAIHKQVISESAAQDKVI